MTKVDIEERRLRRLEKRIAHLAALMRLMAVMGGGSVDADGNIRCSRKAAQRLRELFIRENGRIWEMLHPDGEPEDQAKKTTICAGVAWTGGSRSGQSIARKGQGTDAPRCGHPVDK